MSKPNGSSTGCQRAGSTERPLSYVLISSDWTQTQVRVCSKRPARVAWRPDLVSIDTSCSSPCQRSLDFKTLFGGLEWKCFTFEFRLSRRMAVTAVRSIKLWESTPRLDLSRQSSCL